MAIHPFIRIEGGLLGPDVVDQLLNGELAGRDQRTLVLKVAVVLPTKSRQPLQIRNRFGPYFNDD